MFPSLRRVAEKAIHLRFVCRGKSMSAARERERDRETERQRDRETDRQRDRQTERQRDREREYVLAAQQASSLFFGHSVVQSP